MILGEEEEEDEDEEWTSPQDGYVGRPKPLPRSDTRTSENLAYSKHRTPRLDSSLQYLA